MTDQERKQTAQRLQAVLQADLNSLERLILATPSGPERNRYCDAQIHLRAAMERLA